MDDATYPPGTTWRHTYPTGYEGLITRIAAREYVVEVHALGATGFVATVPSLQAGIAAANAQAGAPSSGDDWHSP